MAIGNTPAEALAALAARAVGDGPANRSLQRLFTAFQIGALRRLTDLADVEEQVHAAGFASVDAGVTWELHATGGDGVTTVGAMASRHLSRLNLRQRAYDVLRAEQTTLRRRIFADWCRRSELRAARWRPEFDLDGLDALIERQIAVLATREQELKRIEASIDRRLRAVEFHLPDGVDVVANAAPRYYRPNDPVLVLAGDGIPAPAPDLGEQVRCALVRTLPDAPDEPGFEALTQLTHPEAGQLTRLGAFGDPAANGLPEPAIALRAWSVPWRPVELAWRVALQLPDELDSGRPLERDVVLKNYTLGERTLDFDPCDDGFDGMADEYEGRAPLAANATVALETQLGKVLDAEDLLAQLAAKPLVAQSLGGFTQALGMLDQGLQLPVRDPAARRWMRRSSSASRTPSPARETSPIAGQPVRPAALRALHAQRAAARRRVRPLARHRPRHGWSGRVGDDPARRQGAAATVAADAGVAAALALADRRSSAHGSVGRARRQPDLRLGGDEPP